MNLTDMSILELVIEVAQIGIPLVFAITVHEAGHAYAAKLLGDPTSAKQGRLSLNPIKHLDLVGSVIMPLLFYIVKAPFLLGYAKPIPVTYSRLQKLPRDVALVAVAGPFANCILILLSALAFNLGPILPYSIQEFWAKICVISIGVNTVICGFNLLPFPPLDGSKILMVIAPRKVGKYIYKLERYSTSFTLFILLLLFSIYYLSPYLGYNLLELAIKSAVDFVLYLVEPLMKLHCISIRSEACGNLL